MFIAAIMLPLLLLSLRSISGQAATGGHNHAAESGKPINLFGTTATKKTTTNNSTMPPHIGCAAFAKANHTPQELEPVNFQLKTPKQAKGVSSARQQTQVSCINNTANTGSVSYPCSNIDLMSFLPLSTFGTSKFPSPNGNDIWGWTHSGREFALMALTTGTAFVEITEPTNPKYIGILRTKTSSSIWRDVKTYNCHAFIVSEAAGHGMQVFDLTQLLNATGSTPVEFVETAHYNKFGNSHNIAINEGTGFAYAVGTNTYSGGLHIVNIQNPSNPVSAGGFASDGYTHDCQCVVYSGPDTRYNNTEICFNYNEDTLTIVDVSNKNSIIQIGRIGYQSAAYTHQGWLTDDGRHVIVDDERDETGTIKTRSHVFNVESLTAPRYVGYHSGLLPTRDHNLYVKGNLVFEANYRAGLQVLRIDNIATPTMTQVAHFDIYPSSNTNDYNGAWSNYPYFPSGSVVVSGIEQGLYVLRSPNNFGTELVVPTTTMNPTADSLTCPTKTPTASPSTKSPTVSPSTKSPTASQPTAIPSTKSPTANPTKRPTVNPSTDPYSVLPSPWLTMDIGTVNLIGSGSFGNSTGTYKVRGSGSGITGSSDQFRYVYQFLIGDGSIKAQLSNQNGTLSSSLAGVMIHESNSTGSKFVGVWRTGSGNSNIRAVRRTTTNSSLTTKTSTSQTPPNCWLRIIRTGNSFAAARSTDGNSWSTISTSTVTMNSNITIGLFVASGNTTILDTSIFSNVIVVV